MATRRATDLPPAPAPGPGQRLRQWLGLRRLAVQAAGAVLLATLALMAVMAALQRWAGADLAGLHPIVWVLGTGVWVAVAVVLLVRPHAQGLLALTEATRALRSDTPPDDAQLPLLTSSDELHRTSVALRRMVDVARAQRQALQARNAQLGSQLQQRTHELSTLQDLSVGLAKTDDLFELVDEALKALAQTLDYSSASVWARDRRNGPGQVVLAGYHSRDAALDELDEQPLRGKRLSRPNLQRYEQIEREREPLIDNNARQSLLSWLWEKVTDDASTSALYRSSRAWMAVPLRFREAVLGVMRVDHQSPGYFDPERARLLSAVCSQAALAMHHAQLLVQERELAVVAERSRIARDLHDAVSQTLFAANVIAGTLARQAQDDLQPDTVRAQAQTLERLNRGALAEMRMLLYELRPDALDTLSLRELLAPPLEALACRGALQIDNQIAPQEALTPEVRVHLYRIAQEALSNVGRHSGAHHVAVHWLPDAQQGPLLRITDDGQGFDIRAEHPGHFGLGNMQTRADAIGARLTLTSAPGEGCEVRVQIMPPGTAPGDNGPAADHPTAEVP